MPIIKIDNNSEKELSEQRLFVNNVGKELVSEIYYLNNQEHEMFGGKKAFNLGVGQSFNIRTLLPNVDYTQLTTNNFVIADSTTKYRGGTTGLNPPEHAYMDLKTIKTYDTETGILSCYLSFINNGGNAQNSNVKVYYVKNPTKLISLGTNNTFDLSSYRNYQDFTLDNFVVQTFSDYRNEITCYVENCPYGAGYTKTYDNQTGVLRFYERGRTDSPTQNVSVYLVEKIV